MPGENTGKLLKIHRGSRSWVCIAVELPSKLPSRPADAERLERSTCQQASAVLMQGVGAHTAVLRRWHDDLQADSSRQLLLSNIEGREVSEFELYRACDVYDVQRSATDRASVLAAQLTRLS